MSVEESVLPHGDDTPSVPNPDEGKYVYCIIESDAPRRFGSIGIGGRKDEVYTIHYGGLAAVVSDTPVQLYDPLRENVMTHDHVNEIVMEEFNLLPMSFGTVFVGEPNVIEFLKDTADALRDVLQKMKDKIELGLKVNWEQETVTREIEEEREDIRRLKEEILSNRLASTYFARMQLGRLVEQALSEKSDSYVREIYDHLRDCAIASRHNKPIGDKMILNASFLVERGRVDDFDRKVQEIAQRYEGKLRFVYSGPWPPYSFVNIRLKLERAGAVT
jgi:gas vesicle protein